MPGCPPPLAAPLLVYYIFSPFPLIYQVSVQSIDCICYVQYFATATSCSTKIRLQVYILILPKFYSTCTVHTVIVKTFAHTVFVSLLLHCNFRSVHCTVHQQYCSTVQFRFREANLKEKYLRFHKKKTGGEAPGPYGRYAYASDQSVSVINENRQ